MKIFTAVGLLCWLAYLPGSGQITSFDVLTIIIMMIRMIITIMIIVIIFIILRFVHCLRRYRDTRHAFPHLTNAGKMMMMLFMTSMAVIMMMIMTRMMGMAMMVMMTIYIYRKIHDNVGDQPYTLHLCHALWCHRSGDHG